MVWEPSGAMGFVVVEAVVVVLLGPGSYLNRQGARNKTTTKGPWSFCSGLNLIPRAGLYRNKNCHSVGHTTLSNRLFTGTEYEEALAKRRGRARARCALWGRDQTGASERARRNPMRQLADCGSLGFVDCQINHETRS